MSKYQDDLKYIEQKLLLEGKDIWDIEIAKKKYEKDYNDLMSEKNDKEFKKE